MEVSSTAQVYECFLASNGICTDTRQLKEGQIFFALQGVNFNGNNFAEEALEKGAAYGVVNDENIARKNERLFFVHDTLAVLQDIARKYRDFLDIPVIAIAGSNGKTTTKELTCAVLEGYYTIHATPGNYNNHIGVPLTLLGIPQDADLAVVEMGNNHEKELYQLCCIARPTHGIITNIGKDHLEGFGSVEGVARAHSELFLYLKETDGVAFVNSMDEHVNRMASRLQHVYRFPQPDDFYYCELKESSPFVELIAQDGETIQTQLIGWYNYFNVVAALCIGKYFDVPDEVARKGVEGYVPSNNRSQVFKRNHHTIILDAYNANPSSMEAALETIEEMEGAHKTVILGDMKEMGEASFEEHKQILDKVRHSGIALAYFCGEEFEKAGQAISDERFRFYTTKKDLVEAIKHHQPDPSIILIKGSRALALEEVAENL